MTAPIVDHWTGTPLLSPEHYCSAVDWFDGDLTTRIHPWTGHGWCGTLWDRVAESAASRELGVELSKRGDL